MFLRWSRRKHPLRSTEKTKETQRFIRRPEEVIQRVVSVAVWLKPCWPKHYRFSRANRCIEFDGRIRCRFWWFALIWKKRARSNSRGDTCYEVAKQVLHEYAPAGLSIFPRQPQWALCLSLHACLLVVVFSEFAATRLWRVGLRWSYYSDRIERWS